MNWFQGKRAVVPVDFSDRSKQAVDVALEMVFRPSDIIVVHVAQVLAAAVPDMVWGAAEEETRAARLTAAFQREFSDRKYKGIKCCARLGDPGHEIVALAEEIEADVIVMPSHGRSGLKRLLLGSVAERVLRLAHCPVIVLRD